MKIGVQMYTVRDYLKTPQEIESTLKKLKSMGFDMVQLSGLGPCDNDRLAGWVQELGIEVCGSHSPWERITDTAELKKLIDEHKKLGATDIGIGYYKPDNSSNLYDAYTDFIKQVNVVCTTLKDNGMTFGYHNHEFEFTKIKGVRILDRLIEECPDLCFILDVFWAQTGGVNPSAYIEKLKGRIKIIHFKDYRMNQQTRQFAEIGEGNLDWNDIIPRSEKNGIPYAVIEQDADFLVDPFESLAMSRKFLVDGGFWNSSENR